MLLGGLAKSLGFGLKGLKPEIPESFGIAFRQSPYFHSLRILPDDCPAVLGLQ